MWNEQLLAMIVAKLLIWNFQRPGAVINMTIAEYNARAIIEGETQILVYKHKNTRGGPAHIHTDADDLKAIKSYLKNYRPISESDDEPLFLTPGKLLSIKVRASSNI